MNVDIVLVSFRTRVRFSPSPIIKKTTLCSLFYYPDFRNWTRTSPVACSEFEREWAEGKNSKRWALSMPVKRERARHSRHLHSFEVWAVLRWSRRKRKSIRMWVRDGETLSFGGQDETGRWRRKNLWFHRSIVRFYRHYLQILV